MKTAKNLKLLLVLFLLTVACKKGPENIRGIPAEPAVKAELKEVEELSEELQKEGFQTFTYKEGDSTYLMQQYFLVLLKKGQNRDQDSLEVAKLQEPHMHHLTKMYEQGYTSLAGPMGDEGEIRGIVIYNTKTLKEADSLANLDPMVKAGRLEVEIHPWWAAKGGKLN